MNSLTVVSKVEVPRRLPPLENKPKALEPKKTIKLPPLKNKPKTPELKLPKPKLPKPKSPKQTLFVWNAPISPAYNLRPFSQETQEMANFAETIPGLEEQWAKEDAEFERQKEEEWIKREEAFRAYEKAEEIEKAERARKFKEMMMKPRVPVVYQTPTPPVGQPKKRGRPKGSKNKPKI
jgi:hypothetical protein